LLRAAEERRGHKKIISLAKKNATFYFYLALTSYYFIHRGAEANLSGCTLEEREVEEKK